MNINIIHPGQKSFEALKTTINEGLEIFRSPHVGNVNANELNLMFGSCFLGAEVQIELVDSIRGDDSYSNPRVALVGSEVITLASRKYSKSRIPGGCVPSNDSVDRLVNHGLKINEEDYMNLQTLHTNSLKQIVPDSVNIKVSSEFFASIGQSVYEIVFEESSKIIDRPLRRVVEDGKIREEHEDISFNNIYGLGISKDQGLLLPLEAMMAIEMVKKVIENNGQDCSIVHVAGPDMIKYTQDENIMNPVRQIVKNVFSGIGLLNGVNIEYIVPCMKTILESSEFPIFFTEDVKSQYDILANNEIYMI